LPLIFSLLRASDFDVEAAQHGVVYLDGLDRHEAQEASLHLWQGQVVEPLGRLQFDIRGVLFVCGGTFTALDKGIACSGRNPEQPITAEALVAAGAQPQWIRHLAAIARAAPLDEETLTRMVAWIDFSCRRSAPAEPQ
jgi:ATP-dependent protease Clp ATPase subunit